MNAQRYFALLREKVVLCFCKKHEFSAVIFVQHEKISFLPQHFCFVQGIPDTDARGRQKHYQELQVSMA